MEKFKIINVYMGLIRNQFYMSAIFKSNISVAGKVQLMSLLFFSGKSKLWVLSRVKIKNDDIF